MALVKYTVQQIKEFAAHLKTLGAYVQQPNPAIVGLLLTQIIGSQDAKSLYPTIMVLLNLGYDTLRGRIYEYNIVGKLLQQLIYIHSIRNNDERVLETAVANFKSALKNIVTAYTSRNKIKSSKAKLIDFTVTYYGNCFKNLVSYDGDFNDILKPKDDKTYKLLKSNLYPLFEALTWIHQLNKGYSQTVIDWVYFNKGFDTKYADKKFVVFEEINSVHTEVKTYTLNEFKKNIATKYLLNPYGTYFDRHQDNKSFEVDLVLGGMADRGYVKNQFLILDAITENWNKLNNKQRLAFALEDEYIDPAIAEEIILLVGDPNEGTRKWQLKNLLSIKFFTLVKDDLMKAKLALISSQKLSESNSIKVTLNSGYGIYGMATWNYGNNLIANSITTGGKIYGIKHFQQIASNRLKKERDKIGSGFYDGKYTPVAEKSI